MASKNTKKAPAKKKAEPQKEKKKPGRKPGQVYVVKKKEETKMDISVSELTEQQKHDAQRDEWLRNGN